MELNKMQRRILEEYHKTGRVYAECPKGSGKTTIMALIGAEEISKNKPVFIAGINNSSTFLLEQAIKKLFSQDISHLIFTKGERNRDFLNLHDGKFDYDECERKICLRTTPIPVLRFSHEDLKNFYPTGMIERMKEEMNSSQFSKEYEGGLKKESDYEERLEKLTR